MLRKHQKLLFFGLCVALNFMCGCGMPSGYPKAHRLEKQARINDVDRHSKSWKQTRSFDEFQWLADNSLKKGIPVAEVSRLLGEPLNVEKGESNDVWWYKIISVENDEHYACYLAIDKGGKLLWVTVKGAL